MKKIFFLLFFICLALRVNAQDEFFEQPQDVFGQADTIKMPACNDQDFKAKILQTAEKYFENQPVSSTLEKRKKVLRLKNLKDFETVSVKDFSPETDFNTANALIMIKINENVEEKDILLCRQKEEDKNIVYIIAYPYLDNVKAHLINLAEKNSDYNAVSFIYP